MPRSRLKHQPPPRPTLQHLEGGVREGTVTVRNLWCGSGGREYDETELARAVVRALAQNRGAVKILSHLPRPHHPRSGPASTGRSFFLAKDDEPGDVFASVDSAVRVYPAGAMVYEQGERKTCFFQLISGHVRIYIAMPDGTDRVLTYAEPGVVFGEGPCFDGKPHYATAMAVRRSEIRVFERQATVDAAQRRPEILQHLIRDLALKQRQLLMHIAATRLTAQQRVILLLNDLVESKRESTPDRAPVRLDTGLTIEELARMLGVTRVTMSRELSELARQGVLAKDGLRIVVLSPLALQEVASKLGV